MSVPSSLRSQELDRIWARVRERLEAHDGSRGRLKLPDLSSASKLVLKSLLGRPVKQSLDLSALEAGFAKLDVGGNLEDALAALGQPVSGVNALLRAERAARRQAREAARSMAASWPEPWAQKWIDEVIRAGVLRGLDVAGAASLLQGVRAVLNHIEECNHAPVSRVELAAQVLGSSHALDSGTRMEVAVARALALRLGPTNTQELWAQAGVHLDLTSAPVLTWGLPLKEECGLFTLARSALDAHIPLHLSRFALQAHPVLVDRGTRILVAENPRVVEAAAQLRSAAPVICSNGWPGSAVLLLIGQLLDAGAELAYHGDFDTAGLAICERMMRLGLTPWQMDAQNYRAAIAAADAAGAVLLKERQAPGATPWDVSLQPLLDEVRRAVHEERLLPGLIAEFF